MLNAQKPAEMFESNHENAYDQLEDVFGAMAALNEEVAAARNDTGRSEADIRVIVRDELKKAGVLEDAK